VQFYGAGSQGHDIKTVNYCSKYIMHDCGSAAWRGVALMVHCGGGGRRFAAAAPPK
jgi:hypothetical protein